MRCSDSSNDVQVLSTGEQILAVIKLFNPDLVLMGVMLANMDGRLMCKDLKAAGMTKHILVILISATDDLAQSIQRSAINPSVAPGTCCSASRPRVSLRACYTASLPSFNNCFAANCPGPSAEPAIKILAIISKTILGVFVCPAYI